MNKLPHIFASFVCCLQLQAEDKVLALASPMTIYISHFLGDRNRLLSVTLNKSASTHLHFRTWSSQTKRRIIADDINAFPKESEFYPTILWFHTLLSKESIPEQPQPNLLGNITVNFGTREKVGPIDFSITSNLDKFPTDTKQPDIFDLSWRTKPYKETRQFSDKHFLTQLKNAFAAISTLQPFRYRATDGSYKIATNSGLKDIRITFYNTRHFPPKAVTHITLTSKDEVNFMQLFQKHQANREWFQKHRKLFFSYANDEDS